MFLQKKENYSGIGETLTQLHCSLENKIKQMSDETLI